MKKMKQNLQAQRDENARLKRDYERSCNEMKHEFEEIKAEMESTWKEQQSLHEAQLERIKHSYEKRLEFETTKNEDLKRENELLKQKITRIKDVFIDPSEHRGGNRIPVALNNTPSVAMSQQPHQDVHP